MGIIIILKDTDIKENSYELIRLIRN